MWSPVCISGTTTDDDLQFICLDDLLASATSPYVEPSSQLAVPENNWEVPITKSPLSINPAFIYATPRTTIKREDSYDVTMVPVESVLRDNTPPLAHGT